MSRLGEWLPKLIYAPVIKHTAPGSHTIPWWSVLDLLLEGHAAQQPQKDRHVIYHCFSKILCFFVGCLWIGFLIIIKISSWLISNGTFHNANIFQNWWIIHAGLTLWFSPTANLSQNWVHLVSQGLPSIKCYDPSILIKLLYITRIIMVNHIIVLYGLSNIWVCQIVYQDEL